MAEQKPPVYIEDGVTYYRASSLSFCPRVFIFARLNYAQRIPAPLQDAFDYGIQNEDQIIHLVEERGYNVRQRQAEVNLRFPHARCIRGHIDGMYTVFQGNYVIEPTVFDVKALSHENVVKCMTDLPKHFPSYALQISAYMHAGGWERAMFFLYDKDEKKLLEHRIDKPYYTEDDLESLIDSHEINWSRYQDTDNLPACTTTTFCPYYHLHKDYSDDPLPYNLSSDLPLLNLVSAYEAADRRVKLLEGVKTTIRKRVEDHLNTAQVRSAEGGGYTVAYTDVKTTRLNTKLVEQELGDRLAEFQSTTTAKRLVVKRT